VLGRSPSSSWFSPVDVRPYELKLPGFLHQRSMKRQRRLAGGPDCLGREHGCALGGDRQPMRRAPLAGALLYIAQTRDVALGGAALFTMALGMGIPLIAVGISEGALPAQIRPVAQSRQAVLRRAAARGGGVDRLAAFAHRQGRYQVRAHRQHRRARREAPRRRASR